MPHRENFLQLGDAARIKVRAVERDDVTGKKGPVDLTGTSGHVVRITDPEGASQEVAGTIDDAALGIFGADFAAGAIAIAGPWKAQGRFTKDGKERHSRVGAFTVEHNLPDPP